MAKRYSRQQIRKLYEERCFFCGESRYELLDAHRILAGECGGTYHALNVVVACALDHRRIHSGEIVIDKKYPSTSGRYVLHYWDNGEERWDEC